MLSARYLSPGCIDVVETPTPSPREGEALVRVEACGICGSDLAIAAGAHPRAVPPLTMGHEFCGSIAEPGGSGLRAGDRVALYPLISCGHCWACGHGHAHVCRDLRLYGIDRDGGMAEFCSVSARNLVPIPASLPSEAGALIEPLAVAVHAAARGRVRCGDQAVVIGAGPIGLLTALVLRATGVERLIAGDVIPSRLKLASELGLAAVDAAGLREAVMDATEGEGAGAVFECAGTDEAAARMTELVRCRGTVVNVSVFKHPPYVDMRAINFKEIAIAGSRVYTRAEFCRAVELAAVLPLDRLVTRVLPLQRAAEAFELQRSRTGVCKVLLAPPSRYGVTPPQKSTRRRLTLDS